MLVPMGELIADVPAPGSDHGKNQPPTFSEQNVIDTRIVRADLLRHVRNVVLDGSAAARFEVDEQQAVTGAEEIARMWFAMQQLLGRPTAADPFASAPQRVEEEMPVDVGERGSFVWVRD